MADEAAFLAAVRERLKGRDPSQRTPHPGPAAQGNRAASAPRALVQTFAEEWAALGGEVCWAAEAGEARVHLVAIARALGARRALFAGDTRLAALGLPDALRREGVEVYGWAEAGAEARQRAAAADLGVTCAAYAVAETGTVVEVGRPGRARASSLLPPAWVAVVPRELVLPTRLAVFQRIKADLGPDFPSVITLSTGPSRTADIENDLTVGVHGPGRVVAMIVG